MFRRRRLVIGLALLCLVAACGGTHDKVGRRYVAIGDSYVSGPAIPDQDPKAPNCVRSDRNYPHLVAKALKRTSLVDVSCGGATTATVENGVTTAQGLLSKPQLDAITSRTKLVTVGIGANDGQVILGMFVSCLIKASATDAKCTNFVDNYAPTVYPGTRDRVVATLTKVKKLAPKAKVLLVGYLRIVPDSGACPVLQITETERAEAMKIEVALTATLRDAASTAHVPFVDVRGISHGHDVCAGKDAWVNGTVKIPGQGAILHPNRAGMRAVAGQVVKAIGDF